MKIYIAKFLRNSWCMESNWFDLSYHKTSEGAEKSIEDYKEEMIKKHNEEIITSERIYGDDPNYEEFIRDLKEEDIFEDCKWKVKPVELKD